MMSRYDSYKDSGIEWIGVIPSHWEVKRLKYVATINDETLSENTNGNLEIEYIEISDVKSGIGIIKTSRLFFQEAPTRARRIVRYRDVIVSTVRTYLKSIAKIDIIKENLIASTGFAVVRAQKINSNYIGYLFYSEQLIEEIESLSTGVSYPAINANQLGDIFIPIPESDEEQESIASFLDQKTAEIDQLIADKKRLIELYEEEKTAVINQAVTKGIDPNVKMKDSRIEWLGEIPEHWEVKKIKWVIDMKSGNGITSEMIKEEGDYPVYGGNGLRGYYHSFTHDGEYILIGRQGALCGNINYGTGKFWASEHALVCSPKTVFVLNWLGELLRIMNLNQYSVSAAQPGLSVENLKILHIPIPRFPEQQKIVHHIESECSRINAKIEKTKKLIDLLAEYRTTLISEVVTGKIKVI